MTFNRINQEFVQCKTSPTKSWSYPNLLHRMKIQQRRLNYLHHLAINPRSTSVHRNKIEHRLVSHLIAVDGQTYICNKLMLQQMLQ